MVAIRINGSESPVRSEGLGRLSDLIELIKSQIDPDHMITGILLNGRDLEEAEWDQNPGQFTTDILEIETGSPSEFVTDRMGQASEIIRACYMDFREARKSFQDGDMQQGNQIMIKGVNVLRAFFEWYGTLIELIPQPQRANFEISDQVTVISEICKRICQQQLYQSWWALGETLEKELEPKLDKLEDFCRKAHRSM